MKNIKVVWNTVGAMMYAVTSIALLGGGAVMFGLFLCVSQAFIWLFGA